MRILQFMVTNEYHIKNENVSAQCENIIDSIISDVQLATFTHIVFDMDPFDIIITFTFFRTSHIGS